MKLISSFHDYYDTVLAQGRDETVLYLRERKAMDDPEVSKNLLPWETPGRFGGAVGIRSVFITDSANQNPNIKRQAWMLTQEDSNNIRYDEAFVVVAGKAHPVWLRHQCGETLLEPKPALRVGDVEIEKLRQGMETDHLANKTLWPNPPKVTVRASRDNADTIRRYDHARQQMLAHDFTDLHLEYGAPVFLMADPSTMAPTRRYTTRLSPDAGLILNPRLADLGLQRILDPFTCFQQISQFISGVVPGQQMPMVTISDASQVRKKGFDPVYGFRTRPHKP